MLGGENKSTIRIMRLGLISFDTALERQMVTVREVAEGAPDVLILCEHPKVITLGRKFKAANLFSSREDLLRQNFQICSVDRGGDVTLHAPGQLIMYPIINLKRAGQDLKVYLRKLEQVAVDLLKDFDIVAQGDDDRRGVWVGPCKGDKIASIGIGVKRWVTYHGLALNVTTDLELFKVIRPCGLDVRMTSVERVMGSAPSMAEVMSSAEKHFVKGFGY